MNYTRFILIAFTFLQIIQVGEAQSGNPAPDPPEPTASEQQLIDFKDKAERSFVVMLKLGQEVLNDQTEHQSTLDQARVLADGIYVYASRFDTTDIIQVVNRNDIFPVLERQPGFVRVRLNDTPSGWINAKDVFVSTVTKPSTGVLQELSVSAGRKVEVIHRLYNSMMALEVSFAKAWNALEAPTPYENDIRKEFYRFTNNARSYYQNHFEGIEVQPAQPVQSIPNFSGELSLSSGSSTFSDQYSASLKEEFKGGLTDLSLKGIYRINPQQHLDMLMDIRSEVLETPFQNNQFRVGYAYQKQGTQFHASAGLNQYKDDFRGINSYDRLNVNTRVKHNLNAKQQVSLQYQLINNNYKSTSSVDYSRHQLVLGSSTRVQKTNELLLTVRGNLSSSDLEQLNFLHLLPSVTYRRNKQKVSTDYLFSFESFSYDQLALRNSIRGNFGIAGRNRSEPGKSRSSELMLSYIAFASNPATDHARVSIRTTANDFLKGNRYSTVGLTARYFPSNEAASFLDFRYDAGVKRKVFAAFAFFNRFYYPEEYILSQAEANIRVGVEAFGFRIGPVLSVRSTVDFENFNVETDGNFYRIGGFVEGTRIFRNGFRLTLNGAYDYGHVYSEDISIDPDTGLINAGDVLTRNPTTIRIAVQAGYTLMKLFDLFATVDYYKIDRDHQLVSGLNPVLASDRVTFRLGFTYRYN